MEPLGPSSERERERERERGRKEGDKKKCRIKLIEVKQSVRIVEGLQIQEPSSGLHDTEYSAIQSSVCCIIASTWCV